MKKILVLLMVVVMGIFGFNVAQVNAQLVKAGEVKEKVLNIHTDFRLSDSIKDFMDKTSDVSKQPNWVKKIFEIDGVTRIFVDQYSVRIFVGALFKTEDIAPKVEKILKDSFPSKKL